MMNRRDFITLLGGATAAWSSVAAAETARKHAVIGTFRHGTPGQNEGLRFRKLFFDGLQELGYMEGRDFDVVIRHAGSTSELPKAAEQLVQLKPMLFSPRRAQPHSRPSRRRQQFRSSLERWETRSR